MVGSELEREGIKWRLRRMVIHRHPVAIAIFGALLTAVLRWPGALNPDSVRQLEQARSFQFTDWHPPMMALLWSVWPQPAFMLLLQVGLLWTGLFLIASTVDGKWRYAILAVGFSPIAVHYGGVIQKDSVLAAGMMVAAGCMAKGWRWAAAGVAILTSFVRVNAGFAVAPLIFRRRRLLWTPLVAVALALSVQMSARLVAERTDVTKSLPLFDLAGIDHYSGGDRFPTGCYTPLFWDTLGEERCDRMRWKIEPGKEWLGAIASHPSAYLQHRIAQFNSGTFFLVPIAQQCVEAPDMHACPASPVKEWVLKNALFWPCVWLVVGALLLTLNLGRVASSICLSGLTYGGAYFFLGVASDFRYFFWTELAVQVALVIAWSKGVPLKVPLLGGVLVAAMGYAARFML